MGAERLLLAGDGGGLLLLLQVAVGWIMAACAGHAHACLAILDTRSTFFWSTSFLATSTIASSQWAPPSPSPSLSPPRTRATTTAHRRPTRPRSPSHSPFPAIVPSLRVPPSIHSRPCRLSLNRRCPTLAAVHRACPLQIRGRAAATGSSITPLCKPPTPTPTQTTPDDCDKPPQNLFFCQPTWA